jgi:fructokinase
MIAMADIVKLSDEDLAWFGEAGSPDEIAREWLGRGPKLVVITRGGQGAIGFTAADRVEVPARKVTVADTVGAGDTFNAGLLAHLHESGLLQRASLAALSRDQIGQALGFAMAAAAVTVSRPGANPPWRHEIDIG